MKLDLDRQVAGEFQQKLVVSQLVELTTDHGLWRLPAVRGHTPSSTPPAPSRSLTPTIKRLSRRRCWCTCCRTWGPLRICALSPWYALPRSAVRSCHQPDPRALCGRGQVCRAFAAVSRDDSLWRRLGHPSWEEHHVAAYASSLITVTRTLLLTGSRVCTVAVWLAGWFVVCGVTGRRGGREPI
jgi:hypothetical protein